MSKILSLIIGGAFLMCASNATALVKPAAIFSDNMVLQQGIKAPVYGTAAPGEAVAVAFCGQKKTVTAGADGRWQVLLDPLAAGGPHEMVISGSTTVTIRNVMVGEVWVCSGQSNMAATLRKQENAERDIAQANLPLIRFFKIDDLTAASPRADILGDWYVCSPETAAACFAVPFYFARALIAARPVPVGLLLAATGGARIENWMSTSALKSDHEFVADVEEKLKQGKWTTWNEGAEKVAAWVEDWKKIRFNDAGNSGVSNGWADTEFDDAVWPDMSLPGLWQEGGKTMKTDRDFDAGAVWFRRTVVIPPAWENKELRLNLCVIDSWDTTYFNGVQVGATGKENTDAFESYVIPPGLVKAGPAVLAVRVFNLAGAGGFKGNANDMFLAPATNQPGAVLSLAGPWKFHVEYRIPWWDMNCPYAAHLMPSIYYHGSIAPLSRYAIRGALWYQGESDVPDAMLYRKLFPALIGDWRRSWNLPPPAAAGAPGGDFPFLFVQLARIGKTNSSPAGAGTWAPLREAQTMTLAVTNTAMAVSFDVTDGNLHPLTKTQIGERLALAARATVYGEKLEYSGPMFQSMTRDGKKLVLRFTHAVGLAAKGEGGLKGFAVAGADDNFAWAKASIDGEKVVLESDTVAEPVQVRYGWTDFPTGNLYNQAGLPASPFRVKLK